MEIKKMDNTIIKNNFAAAFISSIVFIFFAGIYIMPEKIKLFSVILVVGIFIYLFLTNTSILIEKSIFCWLIYMFIGTTVCVLLKISITGDCFEYLVSLLIGLIASIIFYDENAQKGIIKAFIGVSIIVVVGAILQYIAPSILLKINIVTLGEEKYEIFYNAFFQYNILVGFSYQTGVTGYYLALSILISFCYLINRIDTSGLTKKLVLAIIIFGLFLLLLLTRKRGELLTTVLIAIILICFYQRKKPFKIVLITGAFMILVILILFFTKTGQDLLARTFSDNPTSSRDEIYRELFGYIKKSPIFGYGFSSVTTFIKDFTNGHNIYIQTMVETGAIGTMFLLFILAYNIRKSYIVLKYETHFKIDASLSALCFANQLHFIITGMFGNPLYDVYPLIIYMITVGISNSKYRIYRRKKYERKIYN